MRYWKNRAPKGFLSNGTRQVIVGLALLCLSINAQASSVTVEFATSALVNDQYLVDAFIAYNFDDEVLSALTHGVALRIDTYLKIKRERNWLWDPVVREETLSFMLERHALSDHYLLTNLKTEQKEQFQYLDEALRALGAINDHFLFDKSTIDPDASYLGYIKAELNIEALPPPMRPIAYISPQWQAESSWYEWLVK
jgi:uncharacterized protein DUF4390